MPALSNVNFRFVDTAEWTACASRLAQGAGILAGLWGEADCVRMAVRNGTNDHMDVFALRCPDGHFRSVARHHLPAMRLERAITDLFGLKSAGIPDPRPWLDHGKWGVRYPSGNNPQTEFDTAA